MSRPCPAGWCRAGPNPGRPRVAGRTVDLVCFGATLVQPLLFTAPEWGSDKYVEQPLSRREFGCTIAWQTYGN